MKANRAAREEMAGAEVIGAVLLFGIFVATIALLNVTAVPAAGLAAEEEHVAALLNELNGLQLEAESAGTPGKTGATVGRSLALAPTRDVGQDFFSFFMAEPARASGELTFERDYGDIRLQHHVDESTVAYDIGGPTDGLTLGRLTFDPNPVFRHAGIVQLEGGGIVTTETGTQAMRFAPPVSLSVDGSKVVHLTIKARVFDGTDASIGGTTNVRVGLLTQAATLANPATENAVRAAFRVETAHGAAWGAYLNQTAAAAGLSPWAGTAPATGYETSVARGAGADGLDVVEWRVHGLSTNPAAKDIRLASGVAIYAITIG